MTDKPNHVCTMCGHDAGSKFALKRHKSLCGEFSAFGSRRQQVEPQGDRYLLATRPTKYHKFVRD